MPKIKNARSLQEALEFTQQYNPKRIRVGHGDGAYLYVVNPISAWWTGRNDEKRARNTKEVANFLMNRYQEVKKDALAPQATAIFNAKNWPRLQYFFKGQRNEPTILNNGVVRVSPVHTGIEVGVSRAGEKFYTYGTVNGKKFKPTETYAVYDTKLQHIEDEQRQSEYFGRVGVKGHKSYRHNELVVDPEKALKGYEEYLDTTRPTLTTEAKKSFLRKNYVRVTKEQTPAKVEIVGARRVLAFKEDIAYTDFPAKFTRHTLVGSEVVNEQVVDRYDTEVWQRRSQTAEQKKRGVATYDLYKVLDEGELEAQNQSAEFSLDSTLSDPDNVIIDLSDGKQIVYVHATVPQVQLPDDLAHLGEFQIDLPKPNQVAPATGDVPESNPVADLLPPQPVYDPNKWARILIGKDKKPVSAWQEAESPFAGQTQVHTKGRKFGAFTTVTDIATAPDEHKVYQIEEDKLLSQEPAQRLQGISEIGVGHYFDIPDDLLHYMFDHEFTAESVEQAAAVYAIRPQNDHVINTGFSEDTQKKIFRDHVAKYLRFADDVIRLRNPDALLPKEVKNNKALLNDFQTYEFANTLQGALQSIEAHEQDLVGGDGLARLETRFKELKKRYREEPAQRKALRAAYVDFYAKIESMNIALNRAVAANSKSNLDHAIEQLKEFMGPGAYAACLTVEGEALEADHNAKIIQTAERLNQVAKTYAEPVAVLAEAVGWALNRSYYGGADEASAFFSPMDKVVVRKPVEFGEVAETGYVAIPAAPPASVPVVQSQPKVASKPVIAPRPENASPRPVPRARVPASAAPSSLSISTAIDPAVSNFAVQTAVTLSNLSSDAGVTRTRQDVLVQAEVEPTESERAADIARHEARNKDVLPVLPKLTEPVLSINLAQKGGSTPLISDAPLPPVVIAPPLPSAPTPAYTPEDVKNTQQLLDDKKSPKVEAPPPPPPPAPPVIGAPPPPPPLPAIGWRSQSSLNQSSGVVSPRGSAQSLPPLKLSAPLKVARLSDLERVPDLPGAVPTASLSDQILAKKLKPTEKVVKSDSELIRHGRPSMTTVLRERISRQRLAVGSPETIAEADGSGVWDGES